MGFLEFGRFGVHWILVEPLAEAQKDVEKPCGFKPSENDLQQKLVGKLLWDSLLEGTIIVTIHIVKIYRNI